MKEKLQFKIRIKNWFKNHWLKILLSIVFIFINLILWIGYNKLDHNYIDFKIIKKEGI